jgi:hypothetical protein
MTTENVKSADKKPEVFTKPDGKRGKTEETDDINEKGKGLWHNIRAKRKRGEPKAKPGDKDYPKTLDIEGYIGGKNEIDEISNALKRRYVQKATYGRNSSGDLGSQSVRARGAEYSDKLRKKSDKRLKTTVKVKKDLGMYKNREKAEEGYIGGKGEKGRDKGNAGKFDKNTAYSHAKTHNGVVHKDTSGSYLVKHGRGKNVSESVELDEAAINFRKLHQEIMAYAKKHGDIDKEDFEKVASYIKEIGDNQNKPDRANLRFATMKAFVAGMDTDPRDKVYSWLKKYGMFKNGKMVQESESVELDEVAPLIGLAARGLAGAAAGALAKKAAGSAVKSAAGALAKKAAKAAAVGAAGAAGAMAAKSLLSKDKDKNKKESVDGQKSFSQFISELTDKQKAEVAARKAKNVAKRGARRGPSKGTKTVAGDWTADQQKKAKPLGFEIGKNDKHDDVHKTLAKAADASHPSLGGRKVTVKINGKSKEMAHKDLQHAVDLHKRLPLGKKAAVMNLIRDKGHDGVTAAANHFRKTYK